MQNASSATASSVPGSPLGDIAQSCMSSPVRAVSSAAPICDAHKQLLRYGHTGLCVVDASGALVGVISRRDVDVAMRHGLEDSAVITAMSAPVKTIEPTTPLLEIRSLMVTYDLGRLPVVAGEELVGIVTRSDLLRQLCVLEGVLGDLSQLLPRSHISGYISEQAALPVPSIDALYEQLKTRIAVIWPALMLIAKAADAQGWAVYLVGGAVRDLLLNCLGQSYPLTDIDLVVDGAETGAGATLAKIIEASYPQVEAQIYGEFQTATLTWPANENNGAISAPTADGSQMSGQMSSQVSTPAFSIDIVTARTEFYAYPAANPEVEASTIHQDLYRRDFTVNAMALRLDAEPINDSDDGSCTARLLDFFGGWIDLQRGYIRVIHPNSFIEDPTRIFRAVRFSVRLGFDIEAHTEQLIRYAVESGIYARLQTSGHKVPALQSRLAAELKSVLSSAQWAIALTELDRLGALACIHRNMTISPVLWRQLRRMARWQPKFASDQPRWLLLLSLLIAQLSSPDCARVATTLNLGSPSEQRLTKLHQWESALLEQLPQAQRPSQIFNYLRPYGQFELLLIAARHPYTLGVHIWHYIVHLSRMSSPINGATLKRLGYRPGPQFREILTAVHQRILDGELHTAQSAEDYVIKTYPRDDD
ncbi:MAG: CBS domain-containing protein [Phormidesmis sp.]